MALLCYGDQKVKWVRCQEKVDKKSGRPGSHESADELHVSTLHSN